MFRISTIGFVDTRELVGFPRRLGTPALTARGQGYFYFGNFSAPTRLWSADGPLAGRGICAQMLVGDAPDSMVPVGNPAEHYFAGQSMAVMSRCLAVQY